MSQYFEFTNGLAVSKNNIYTLEILLADLTLDPKKFEQMDKILKNINKDLNKLVEIVRYENEELK